MSIHRNLILVKNFFKSRSRVFKWEKAIEHRSRRGRRRKITELLNTALIGMILMCKSMLKVEHVSGILGKIGKKLGIKDRVPDSTLGEFLRKSEPEGIREQLRLMIMEERRRKSIEPTALPVGVISIDGKKVWSGKYKANKYCKETKNNEGIYYYLKVMRAVLISSSAKVCIDQAPIKRNEVEDFKEFYKGLEKKYRDLYEGIVVDAGYCSERNARIIEESKKWYVFALKNNQKELLMEAERILQCQAETQGCEAETEWEMDSSRGLIKRKLWRTREMEGYLGWSHLRQAWLVRTVRREENREEKILEDRYFITNLFWNVLKPKYILNLVRFHWGIENNCFWTLDTQFEEDNSRWAVKGNGLFNVTLLRIIAYNIYQLLRCNYLRSKEKRRLPFHVLLSWFQLFSFSQYNFHDELCYGDVALS